MAKGSALSRALAFFRDEPDLDVVRVAFARATEIVNERHSTASKENVKPPRQPRRQKIEGAVLKATREHESLGNA
jgi:hypothetical protein